MSKCAHAVYEIVVCGIFICCFVGPRRPEIVKSIDSISRISRVYVKLLPNFAVTPCSKKNIAG
jgi:hypothetical protein